MATTTTPAVDDRVLKDLDIDPDLPCECRAHQLHGHTGPAEWIVTAQPGCGCPPERPLYCDQCLNLAMSLTRVRTCMHETCGRKFTSSFADTIIATERIR